MQRLVIAGVAALCVSLAKPATAEDWPTHTLTMINTFAPGGPNDVPARLFAQRMGRFSGRRLSSRMSPVQAA